MKISVITVSYNSGNTIEKTIQSIINQTMCEKEYIIIDGNSSDGTVEIIKKYSEYIDYWISEPDEGVYDAMNKGIRHATGDIIAFLNADDWYETDTFKKVTGYFKENDIDCLAGGANLILNDHIIQKAIPLCEEEDIHFSMIYIHPAFFVKKRLFDELGMFDVKYHIAADYDFILRAHNAGYRFMKTRDIFTNFKQDGLSAVQQYGSLKEAKLIALKNVGQHGRNLYNKIENSIDLEGAYRKTIVNIVCKEEPEYITNMIKRRGMESVYVWGTGDIAFQCMCLLLKVQIGIIGFIDNYNTKEWFNGYKIYRPEKVPVNAVICIGVEKYKNEIIRQLKEMGFDNNQFLVFSDISMSVLEYGKAKYSNEVYDFVDEYV